MTRPIPLSLLALALSLPAAACSDDAAPPTLEEAFVLTSVAGEELPYSFRSPVSNPLTVVVRSDEIRFFDDETWQRRQIWSELFDGEERVRSLDTEGEIQQGFEGLVLSYRCRDEASCVPPDAFQLREGELVMQGAWLWPGTTDLRFREVERTHVGG